MFPSMWMHRCWYSLLVCGFLSFALDIPSQAFDITRKCSNPWYLILSNVWWANSTHDNFFFQIYFQTSFSYESFNQYWKNPVKWRIHVKAFHCEKKPVNLLSNPTSWCWFLVPKKDYCCVDLIYFIPERTNKLLKWAAKLAEVETEPQVKNGQDNP